MTEQLTEIAHQALSETHNILQSRSMASRNWDAMLQRDRAFLVRAAQVDTETAYMDWDLLAAQDQRQLRKAAKRAAEWARNLGALS